MTTRILVTGGSGFLGSTVVDRLGLTGHQEIFAPRSSQFDLTDKDAIQRLLREYRPTRVLHLAATVGGIGANMRSPGTFFYENAVMGLHLMEESRVAGVEKFVSIGTVCSYPKYAPVPFKEEDLWEGYPEETNAPYGLAKKMLLVQAQAYRAQFLFNSIHLLPVNLYGPRDNFDPQSSHVIPALIRKFLEAKEQGQDHIIAWGTGSASREFLYVDDAAEAIVMALDQYDEPEPLNIGSGKEITIKALTELIADLVGFDGKIQWDPSKPDGQPRRCLDVTKAEKFLGFTAKTDLREGLLKTVEWYLGTLQNKR